MFHNHNPNSAGTAGGLSALAYAPAWWHLGAVWAHAGRPRGTGTQAKNTGRPALLRSENGTTNSSSSGRHHEAGAPIAHDLGQRRPPPRPPDWG